MDMEGMAELPELDLDLSRQSTCWCVIPIAHPSGRESLPAPRRTAPKRAGRKIPRPRACENGFSPERPGIPETPEN